MVASRAVCAVLVLLSLGIGRCVRAQDDTDYIPGRPWTAVIPDPDRVDWTSPDRPGYRYRGMLPQHQRFYELVQAKRARGEELSDADRRFIGYLVAVRRWPEGPRPNAFWRAFLRYLRARTTDELNFAQRLMLWEALSRGLVPMDMPQDERARNVISYLRSEPFRARNWFERTFGRVEPWMDYHLAAQGYDLRDSGAPGNVFPNDPFNGMQITYNVSGAVLGAPQDSPGFTTGRNFEGTLVPGTLSVSGSVSVGGYGATLTARVWAGDREDRVKVWIPNEQGGGRHSYSLSVPVPPGTRSGGFSIRLDGSYAMGGGHRGLYVAASLVQGEADAAAERARLDAEWRAQVEKTLRELGYEETPAGREVREMREALAAGEAAWRAYCERKDAQMRGEKTDAERQFDELRRATQGTQEEWDAYVAAHSGGGGQTPPAGGQGAGGDGQTPAGAGQTVGATLPDVGGLTVGTGSSGGTTTGTADHFDQAAQVCGAMDYTDLPAGSLAVAIWARDGVELTRSQREIGGTGWVSFSLMTQDAGGLPPGTYTLTIMVGDTVLGRKTFTIGAGEG